MTTEQLMKLRSIERIVFCPANDLVPRDEWHAWPFGSYLADHCGQGASIEEAIQDAVERQAREAA